MAMSSKTSVPSIGSDSLLAIQPRPIRLSVMVASEEM